MINRYQIPQIEEIFSEESKYKRWLIVEKEVLFSLAEQLNLSTEELQQFSKELPSISYQEVKNAEAKTKHDFVAFLRVLEEKTKHFSFSKYIHYGLTSSDVIDTSNSLALREVNQLLVQGIEKLQKTLYSLSYKYLNTIQVGRTHGKHAEPTSFGYKFAITYQELEAALEMLYISRRQVEVVSIKGSTGTYAHIGPETQEELARRLQLFSLYCSTQTLPRGRYSSYLYSLSLIGQILNSLSFNLRTLAREEINEISIDPSKNQIGSSSMPHKNNPVVLENISGLSRWLSKIAELSQDNIPLWDERDISHSSNERMSLMDAPTLLFNIVFKMNSILQSLQVNATQLSNNLELTKGLINSQSAMLSLIKSPSTTSRSEAHKLISQLSHQVSSGEVSSFEEALQNSSLSLEGINTSLQLSRYVSHLPKVYHQIFKNEIEHKYCVSQIFNRHEIDNSIHFLAQRINWYYMGNNPWIEKESPSKEEMVDKQYNNSVLVISLLEGSAALTGFILPLLHFPSIYVSIHYSFSGLTKKLRQMKADASITQEEIISFVEEEISKTNEYQKILKLSSRFPRILILEDIVDSKITLKTLYKMLSKLKNIEEIKSASLFVKIVDKDIDRLYREEYYPPSLFPSDYSGSVTEKQLTAYNFKNWTEDSNFKLVNWYGRLIVQENVWVVGYGLDSDQKYRNFQSLREINQAYT